MAQEHRFRTRPFADDEPNEIAVVEDPTGIVMVSLPDSSRDDSTPHEDFQTPPEDFLLTSSEEQRATTIVDGPADHRIEGEIGGDTMAVDDGCTDIEKTVDLGKGLDNLGFSGLQLTQVIECNDRVSGVDFSMNKLSDDESKKFGELHREPYESASKKLKISPGNCVGNNEQPMVVENAATQVLELEFEIFESLDLGEDTMFVDLPLKETEEISGPSKNVDNIEKFKCASSSDVKGQLLKDLLDALKMVAKEVDYGSEDVDFLETAEKSGMSFPRPRWWPPEGFAGD